MRWMFLAIVVLGGSCTPTPTPTQSPVRRPVQALMVVSGTVTEVGQVWTMNGDGSIVITLKNGQKITVGIRGWPADYPRTQIELKSSKYIQDLIGHTVQIRGQLKDGYISADILTEM